ncbi:MAG: hypothetical protein ACI4I3_06395 [Acutalibacteraceae bacterium]
MNKNTDRARQFMPFAALTGFYGIIKERESRSEPRHELSEDEEKILSDRMIRVRKGMMVKLTFYNGSRYETVTGMVSDIDLIYRSITIVKRKIYLDDVIDIGSEEFNGNDANY